MANSTFSHVIRSLFSQDKIVDFLFNMALLGFPFWLPIAVFQNRLLEPPRVLRGSQAVVCLAAIRRRRFTRCAQSFFPSPQSVRKIRMRLAHSLRNSFFPMARGTACTRRFRLDLSNRTWCQPFADRYIFKPATEYRGSNDGFPHLLGTDDAGRDILVRLVYGTRISITVGLVAVEHLLDDRLRRRSFGGVFSAEPWTASFPGSSEVVMLFPSFFLILTLVALLGPSIYIIMFVIGITGWPSIARLIRGEVLKQRVSDYVSAARALGLTHRRVIFPAYLAERAVAGTRCRPVWDRQRHNNGGNSKPAGIRSPTTSPELGECPATCISILPVLVASHISCDRYFLNRHDLQPHRQRFARCHGPPAARDAVAAG